MEDAPEAKDLRPHHHSDDHSDTHDVGFSSGPAVSTPPAPGSNPEPTPVGPAAPVITPASPTPAVTADQSHNTHDGSHILQWLTSMFWGLTILALVFLTASVFERLIVGTDSYTFNYYVIASLIILLPLAFVCDVVYSKQEPGKKIGASSRIMAAYSIIFALFGILALLGIAWNIVAWATGSGIDHSSSISGIVSGVFIFAYYLASFMRTLNPTHIGWLPKVYRFGVLGLVVIFIILGFTKPTFGDTSYTGANRSGSLYDSSSSSSSSSAQTYSSSYSQNKYGSGGKLEPADVGGTQCNIPTLSDGSTTGQVAIAGGATCVEAEADIQGANGKQGGDYKTNSYTCTSTSQSSGTRWSSYWNNDFYSYNCTSGSKQVAFNLQTEDQK